MPTDLCRINLLQLAVQRGQGIHQNWDVLKSSSLRYLMKPVQTVHPRHLQVKEHEIWSPILNDLRLHPGKGDRCLIKCGQVNVCIWLKGHPDEVEISRTVIHDKKV